MGKTIYLSAKINRDEGFMADFAKELEDRGHRIAVKWWELPPLPKPFMEHIETSAPAAEHMLRAAAESDICIMFPSDYVIGAAAEYAAAIIGQKEDPEKEVIVVNPYDVERQSLFYAHPAVIAVRCLEEVRQRHWY